MELNLEKGQRVDLKKEAPGLTIAIIGLGWDVNAGNSGSFDLDAFAFLLKGGKLTSTADVIFFGNKTAQGVTHMGDNLTGAGDGDDEQIKIDLAAVDAEVDEILIGVNIYQAATKRQNFGMVNNSFIRLVDSVTGAEILKYDLTEESSINTGFILGKLYRKDGEFRFQAVGEGLNGDINQIADKYK